MIYDSILGTIGSTPIVRINRLAPAGTHDVREVRVLQSAVLGQGSPRDRDHRGRRAARHAQAGPDRGRSHFGQHRHRARDGVRRQGLPVRRDDGRDLLDRAPQDHAHARREGDPHAGRRTRPGHGAQGRGARGEARLVPRAPVREPGQSGVSPQHHRPGNPAGLRRAAARPFRHGLGHGRHAHRRRRDHQARASRSEDHRDRTRSARSCWAASRWRRTRSRAGRRTSCRPC